MSMASMVRNEEWYAFDSIGFGDGRIFALVPQWSGGKLLEISAFEHSTFEQFNRVTAEDVCGLMQMWSQPVDSTVLLGGGGSYEEDGYVASFRDAQLDWIVFLTCCGPFALSGVDAAYVRVRTAADQVLQITRANPLEILVFLGETSHG